VFKDNQDNQSEEIFDKIYFEIKFMPKGKILRKFKNNYDKI